MANDALEKSESFASRKGDSKYNNEDNSEREIDNIGERKKDDSVDVDPKPEGDQGDACNVEGAEKVDDRGENVDQEESKVDPDISLDQLFEEIDQFIRTVSGFGDKSQAVVIPNEIEKFLKKVEKIIEAYEPCESRIGEVPDDDSTLVMAVNHLSKLIQVLGGFASESNVTLLLNETSSVLHRAMLFWEDELRCLLEESKDASSNSSTTDPSRGLKAKSFKTSDQETDYCTLPNQSESAEGECFPSYPAEAVSKVNLISKLMISAGYQAEFCYVFVISRLHAFEEELNRLGFENVSIDDVQKMQWETLEGEIASWIRVLKRCFGHLLPGEQKFYSSVFSDHPSLSKDLFSDIARAVIIRLVNFAEAAAMTKRSTEKLFKFLDMYENLRDLIPTIDKSFYTEHCAEELHSELSLVCSWLAEAAVSIFSELENSIKNENAKTPVPSGAVHPLTRYTMNYLKYACEYKDTLEHVFQQHQKADQSQVCSEAAAERQKQTDDNQEGEKQSSFTAQLMTILDLLDANLDAKSNLYRDPALRYIFLMNNGRYMLKNIRESPEIHQAVGDPWCRKRSSDMRHYHKSYQRETWSKVLQCLNQEGLQVNGKVYKPNLKERFKNFNQLFDEIHKTQTTWVVSDGQLQSELRVSISAVMIPAYRSFVARFGQHFTPGRQTEKYIKYQPEDIEAAIDELFDGNPNSMARRR